MNTPLATFTHPCPAASSIAFIQVNQSLVVLEFVA